MKMKFKVPPTKEQGSYSGNCSASYAETYRKNALWHYNSARAHDGLPPVKRMPRGTTYERQDSETAKICHHCAKPIVWNRHWDGSKYSGGHWAHAILQQDGKLENARMEQRCAGKPTWATPKRGEGKAVK